MTGLGMYYAQAQGEKGRFITGNLGIDSVLVRKEKLL
jgi:hypothetical protein